MNNGIYRINPDSPQLYNGMVVSYGIIPILNALADMADSRNRVAWTLFLINIETLIRDRKEKELNPTKTVEDVLVDINVMSQYIASYNSFVLPRNSNIKATVCFYMSHYENIPSSHIRDKLPKGTEDRWRIRDAIQQRLVDNEFNMSFDNTDVIFDIADGRGKYPHMQLVNDLSNQYPGIAHRKVLMVSHVPLDFHVYRSFKEFTLLESYTGAFKTVRDLGKKVFQLDSVPFNKYTHLLLGDKWYLKQLVDNKTKKLINERASKENWSVLPDKAILKSLLDMNISTYTEFVKPDI